MNDIWEKTTFKIGAILVAFNVNMEGLTKFG
jgi:hypothetical protein